MIATLFSLLVLGTNPSAQVDSPSLQAPQAPRLRLDDLERWKQHVHPSEDELAFEAIEWIPSFAEGVRRSESERRPLLFWAMNGHPLGCT